jgi:hypothetical protein
MKNKVFVVFKGINSQGRLSKDNIFEWAEKECKKHLVFNPDLPSSQVAKGKTNAYLIMKKNIQDQSEIKKEQSFEGEINENKD